MSRERPPQQDLPQEGLPFDLDALLHDARGVIADAGSIEALESARVELLGKKGRLTNTLKSIGQLPAAEKPAAGQAINQTKQAVQALLDERRLLLENAELQSRLTQDALDVTLPGRADAIGGLHPITLTLERITALFAQIGFDVVVGPEVEDDYHNFEALNFPAHHPARAMHDTLLF